MYMTKQQQTAFSGQKDLSNLQRTAGNKAYAMDVDMIWKTYDENGERFVAVLDAKHGEMKVFDPFTVGSKDWSNHKSLEKMAKALEIPYFVVITYMHKTVPMVYLVSLNELANQYVKTTIEKDEAGHICLAGKWLTPMEYSKLNYTIRNEEWNGNESSKECLCEKGVCRNLDICPTLKIHYLRDLSDVRVEYTCFLATYCC